MESRFSKKTNRNNEVVLMKIIKEFLKKLLKKIEWLFLFALIKFLDEGEKNNGN